MHRCRGRLGVFSFWWVTMGPPLEAVHEARLALNVCNRLGMHGFACCCQVSLSVIHLLTQRSVPAAHMRRCPAQGCAGVHAG